MFLYVFFIMLVIWQRRENHYKYFLKPLDMEFTPGGILDLSRNFLAFAIAGMAEEMM